MLVNLSDVGAPCGILAGMTLKHIDWFFDLTADYFEENSLSEMPVCYN